MPESIPFDPPPLADVYVAIGLSSEALQLQSARLASLGYRVNQHNDWNCLLADRPLPDSRPAPQVVVHAGFVFAEGIREALDKDISPDTVRRLTEYCQQIDRLADRIDGDFGFVRFDADSRQLLVVRACGGQVPFYIWQRSGSVTVATRCSDLVSVGGWNEGPEPLTTALAVTGRHLYPKRRSHLKNVNLLPAGEACVISVDRSPRWIAYWNPQPSVMPDRPNLDKRVQHQRRLRQLLIEGLDANLNPFGGNAISLSGGVDSASLTALITEVVQRPLASWSRVPMRDEKYFDREMYFLERIRQRYQIAKYWQFSGSNSEVIDMFTASPFSLALPPLAVLVAAASIPSDERPRVIVGGEGADEIVGSDNFTLWDWAYSTPLWRCVLPGTAPSIARGLRRWQRGRDFGSYRGDGALPLPDRMPEMFSAKIHDEFEAYRSDLRIRADAMSDANRQSWLQISLFDFQTASWEAASELGIRRHFPFRSRKIIELCLSTHPSERLGRTTKLLMRGALNGDVEAEFLYRADKGSFGRSTTAVKTDPSAVVSQLDSFPAYRALLSADLTCSTYAGPHEVLYLKLLNSLAERQSRFMGSKA